VAGLAAKVRNPSVGVGPGSTFRRDSRVAREDDEGDSTRDRQSILVRPDALLESRTRMRLLAILALASTTALVGTACISAPTSRQWMGIGFRTPEQAVRTFQVAIRADEAELEYRCFSDDFRRRNRISKMVWLEAREELRRKYPWMRRGIVDAEFAAPAVVLGDRARAELVTHGVRIRVEFVREDFVEIYGRDGLLYDDFKSFERTTGIQNGSDGGRWIYGTFELPPTVPEGAETTELRFGREWKLDAFETVDPP